MDESKKLFGVKMMERGGELFVGVSVQNLS